MLTFTVIHNSSRFRNGTSPAGLAGYGPWMTYDQLKSFKNISECDFLRVTSRQFWFPFEMATWTFTPTVRCFLSDFLSDFSTHFLEINIGYIFTWHFQIKVADLFEVLKCHMQPSVGLDAQIKLKYIISVCPSVIMSVWVMPNESWGDINSRSNTINLRFLKISWQAVHHKMP